MNVFATTGALLLASLPAVFAHGNIVDPAAAWVQGYPANGYISEVSNTLWGEQDGATYGYGPEGAVKYFTKNFPDSGVTTLKDLILENQKMYADTIDKECGYTILDEAKRVAMPANVKFSGFSHPGPCELWCDDNKLAFANDCAATYPSGTVPVDTSKCAGANKFTIYWLAVHSAPWQVYTNCAYLKGGSGGAATTPATTPKSSAKTPTVTTAAPVADEADEPATDGSDEYATDAPATPATPAPAASTPSPTKKCTAKVRRA